MAAKKKRGPIRQLELPGAGPAVGTPGQPAGAVAAAKDEDTDNGAANIVAEAVAVEAARPFSPDQIQSP